MLNAYGIDDGGASVAPQMGQGSVSPNMAAPSLAEGGAIPDDDEVGEASPNTDVADYSGAMQIVRQALNYGRQQHGLPASKPQEAQQADTAIPDEEDSGESYAEGGVIEDDTVAAHEQAFPDDGNDPAPDEASLRDEYPQQAAQPEPAPAEGALRADPEGADPAIPEGADMGNPTGAPQGGAGVDPQQIMRYLQRADAMPEPQAQQLEASVSGGGIGSDAHHDRNEVTMKAVEAAGDDAKRFSYLQRNAKRYEGDLALAFHAAQGTPERPANLGTAAQRANAAFANVPDATDVKFAPGDNGMTATVRQLGAAHGQHYNLTPQQFLELTKPGGTGQWDKITSSGGVIGALNSLTGGEEGGAPGQQRAIGNVPSSTMDRFSGIKTGPKNNIGLPQSGGGDVGEQSPVGMDGPEYNGRPAARDAARQSNRSVQAGYDNTLIKASPQYKQLNPDWGKGKENLNATVQVKGFGDTPDRTEIGGVDQTPNAHEKALQLVRAKNEGRVGRAGKDYDREEKLEKLKQEGRSKLAETNNTGKNERATLGTGSREKIAANRLMEQARERESREGRNAASNAEKLLASKILSGDKTRSPEEKAVEQQMQQRALQALQPRQNAPQQQAPAGGQQSPQDQAAIAWANANPNDPRAAKIKQLHGIQ